MGAFRRAATGHRVLIADAKHTFFHTLRDALGRLHCECEVALELPTARAILRERQMDLVAVNAGLAEADDEALIADMKSRAPTCSWSSTTARRIGPARGFCAGSEPTVT